MPSAPKTPSHTLAAILTPIGQGGIAILRVWGPRAVDLARELFRPKAAPPTHPDAHRLHYGHIVDDGEAVDEVLVRFVPAEEAPGGLPLVEVDCHGGVVAVQRVLECFVRRGAKAVEPEAHVEHCSRGRIEAEATRALLQAATPLGVETLLDQLNGALDAAVRRLPWARPEAAADGLHALLATERLGRALWQPPTVALVGPTNAGKSTLFNALAREERMIVSPRPGTTRDAVGAEVALGGVPVWLIDTAGERDPDSPIEAQAIARARAAARAAGLALLVLDASEPLPVPFEKLEGMFPKSRLTVLNKADLGLAPWARGVAEGIVVSAAKGDGLDALAARLVETLVGGAERVPGRAVVFTDRQAATLREALHALEAGDQEEARRLAESLL